MLLKSSNSAFSPFKSISNTKRSSKPFLLLDNSKFKTKNPAIREMQNNSKSIKNQKPFKRIIINKKLPSKFSNCKIKRFELINQDKYENQHSDSKNLEQKIENNQVSKIFSQRREVILYKDENLGFGFIAGSEKPLKVRFVTPGE